ncbi:carbohydrate kinase family protein [bacterium]|nr:carbohydrate kinase family protein [bacterium]
MLKKFDVITIGGATQDIMYYTDDAEIIKNKTNITKQKLIAFEFGAKIISKNVHLTFGGGGMNTAINFSKLGLKTATFLNLGQDWIGDLISKELNKYKISNKYISRSNEYNGFSFIINHNQTNEHAIFGHRGANDKLKTDSQKISNLNTKWIYIASLSGNDHLVKQNIKNIFQKKNTKIAWNPGNSQLKFGFKFFKKYLPRTTLFNINKDEAIELVLSSGMKTTNLNKLIKTIYSWGPKIVAITDGNKGAYIFDGQEIYFQKATNNKALNTTGAGDAFGSSLVAGLIIYNNRAELDKNNLEKALRLAIIQSGAVVKKIGAQIGLLNKKELKKYIK